MNNTNKLDVTKLDKQAAELGFSYRRGIQRGAGYIIVDEISGETPLGDDYTATLKAIKEFLDNVFKQLKDKAKALGFSYEQDSEDRDGYVLIDDSTGEIVLGDGYTATLKDTREYIDSAANDLDVEVEVTKLKKVKPPAPATISKALRGHQHAAEIRAMAKSAKVADQSGPTLHDIKLEVRALQSRESFNPNWNDIGGHEINEHDEADDRDLKQFLEDEKRKRESFEKYLAPDKSEPAFTTPTATAAPQVVLVKRRNVKQLVAESQAKAVAEEADLEAELKKARARVRAKNKAG
jgi:hypothetical protein